MIFSLNFRLTARLHRWLFPVAAQMLRAQDIRHRLHTAQREALSLRLDQAARQHQATLDEHALCLDALMSLVAINEGGDWSTVLCDDTVLPEDLQAYLHTVVARA